MVKVEAAWDDDAQVWTVTSSDVLGLVAEADTIDLLRVKLQNLVPELLAANGLDAEQAPAVQVILCKRI